MKNLLVITLIVLALSTVSFAQGTTRDTVWNERKTTSHAKWYLALGISPLPGFHTVGFHFVVGLSVPLGSAVTFLPKIEFHRFPDVRSYYPWAGGISRQSMMFGACMRYRISPSPTGVAPLLQVGAGLARATSPSGAIGTNVYYELGGGMSIRWPRGLDLILTVRYVSVLLDQGSLNYLPLTIGIQL